MDRVYQLKRNAVSNLRYHKRDTLENNPVPLGIQDNVLEETVCKAFSLTGINMFPDELHSCHWVNKKDQVIGKLKCRKHRQNVLYSRRNVQSKGFHLTQMKLSCKLFVNESLSHENQQLIYIILKLKSEKKNYSTWF